MPTIIDKSYTDNVALLEYLLSRDEVSLGQLVEDSFKRTLTLSAASYFEHQITEALRKYSLRRAGADSCIMAMMRMKVLSRQYHTFFDWDNRQAGTFYRLLGDIGSDLKKECGTDPLKSAVAAFLELGNLRNLLVHQNFANYNFEKTTKEVYGLYQGASIFVDRVIEKLAANPPIEELQQRIRDRAYEIYVNRGKLEGLATDDWIQAEAEILGK